MEELEERITVVESTNTEGQAQCTCHTKTAKAIKRLEHKAMDQEARQLLYKEYTVCGATLRGRASCRLW